MVRAALHRAHPRHHLRQLLQDFHGHSWHIPWRLLEFKHWKEPQPNPAFPSTPQPPPQDNPAPSPGLSPPRTPRPLPVSPLTGQLCWGSRALPAGKRNPFPPHSLPRTLRHLLVSHPSSSRGWSQRSRAELWGQSRACPAAAVGLLCPVPLVLFPLGIGCGAGTPAHLVLLSQGELEPLRGKSTSTAGLFKLPPVFRSMGAACRVFSRGQESLEFGDF